MDLDLQGPRSAARCCSTVGGENFPLQILDEGGDVEGLHVGELGDTARLSHHSAKRRVTFRYALRVWSLLILGGEKFQDAPGGLRRRREQRRGLQLRRRGED